MLIKPTRQQIERWLKVIQPYCSENFWCRCPISSAIMQELGIPFTTTNSVFQLTPFFNATKNGNVPTENGSLWVPSSPKDRENATRFIAAVDGCGCKSYNEVISAYGTDKFEFEYEES